MIPLNTFQMLFQELSAFVASVLVNLWLDALPCTLYVLCMTTSVWVNKVFWMIDSKMPISMSRKSLNICSPTVTENGGSSSHMPSYNGYEGLSWAVFDNLQNGQTSMSLHFQYSKNPVVSSPRSSKTTTVILEEKNATLDTLEMETQNVTKYLIL